jgi:hypothetical protein
VATGRKERRPVYRVDFTPAPGADPGINAVKGILKALLRRFGFRAVSIEELPGPAPTVEEAANENAGVRGSGQARDAGD